MKKLKVCLVVSVLVIIALGVLLFLSMTGKLTKVNCSCADCKADYTLDVSKLESIKKGDYNTLKIIGDEYNVITLSTEGKVLFDYEREITNVNNAIDIVRAPDNFLYILTKDGDIYKYYIGVTNNDGMEATKVDEYKDIKRLVEYSSSRRNAGGCNYIIAIDKDNNYKVLNEFCV